MRIGLIGLGLLGRAMAGRLVVAGYGVSGYDLASAAREEAARLGVEVAPDACAVTEDAAVVLLSLMTSDDRRRLLWGGQAMAAALHPGMVLLDTTTARPEDIEADGQRLLAERQVRLVDVCISGSSQTVADGQALALVGDRGDRATYRGLLEAFTKKQYFFGAPGLGNRAKLIVNLVYGLHRLVLAEALGLAQRGGFDPALILEVLREGGTYAAVMDTKGPKMLSGEYTPPAARLAQHAKDVGLILEYARSVGARVPLSEVHAGLIAEVVAAGHGDLDNAAIFKAFE